MPMSQYALRPAHLARRIVRLRSTRIVRPLVHCRKALVAHAAKLSALGVLLLAAMRGGSLNAAEADDMAAHRQAFANQVAPLVKKLCLDCHSGDSPEADVALDRFAKLDDVLTDRKTWRRVLGQLRGGAMPPDDADQPRPAEREALIAWTKGALSLVDCSGPANPGRVTLRRLNRVEYQNTVRDLLGVEYKPAADFPADDVGYGFDNIGDVLSLPPVLMEKYLDAAEVIAARAVAAEQPKSQLDRRVPASQLAATAGGGGTRTRWDRVLTSNGELYAHIDVPAHGKYRLRALVYGDQAGGEPVKLQFRVDGKPAGPVIATKSTAGRPEHVSAETKLEPGRRRIGVAFLNDYYNPGARDRRQRDRNLIVNYVEITGPLDAPAKTDLGQRRVFVARPSDKLSPPNAARQILTHLAGRAYRRPATQAEIERLLKLFEIGRQKGKSFEAGIELAVQAVLVSPHFLFRVEVDPDENDADGVRTLSDHEMATRLSYFLWSSMPDEELLTLASKGELRRGDTLARQVKRMLANDRAESLATHFAVQWLELRNLDDMEPDQRRFPTFSKKLAADMEREAELFFADVIRRDRPITDLLSSQDTFVNERLARHYGLKNVSGEEFRRVSLAGTARGGVLTMAGVLTVTSNPTRTSPVKRGKWVLENLLGEPPPPPPANVPELEEGEQVELKGTLRERLVQHRTKASCAACHKLMDPLGFALENFDAVGRWRDKEHGRPIDAAAELPTGEKISGAADLRQVLLKTKKERFVRCFVEKLLTYALGRGLEYYDRCAVDKIVAAAKTADYRFSAVVEAIVESEPFQKRATRAKAAG